MSKVYISCLDLRNNTRDSARLSWFITHNRTEDAINLVKKYYDYERKLCKRVIKDFISLIGGNNYVKEMAESTEKNNPEYLI